MGHVQIVEYLVHTANAKAAHADTDGWTALHNASAKGYGHLPERWLKFL